LNLVLPARAEEDKREICRVVFQSYLAMAFAAGVIDPSGFYYYYKYGMISYEWCMIYYAA